MKNWVSIVRDYYRFLSDRRTARGHYVCPDFRLLAAVLLSSAVLIAVSYIFIDPLFMEWFAAGNSHHSGIFRLTTDIGKSNWILVGTGSILFFMIVNMNNRLSSAFLLNWHHIFLKFYFIFTTIALSGLLAIILKNMIGRARPEYAEKLSMWTSSPLTHVYDYASFPSGHSTTMGAFAVVMFLIMPRYGWLFILLAIWVGISRVMIGVHYPSDVVAGLLLGAIFTWIFARSFARKRLLFEFGNESQLQLRNLSAKRARRRIRKYLPASNGLGLIIPRRHSVG